MKTRRRAMWVQFRLTMGWGVVARSRAGAHAQCTHTNTRKLNGAARGSLCRNLPITPSWPLDAARRTALQAESREPRGGKTYLAGEPIRVENNYFRGPSL